MIVADYDSDGATACAVGMRALREFGADVDFLVPNRFEYGYGLTPEIVALAKKLKQPDILITVDNGIASVEGVAAANALGMRVLITDHHLPGATLPDAACIINPNQPGCGFPSKHLAGVGVMFYLMLALRAELRTRGGFPNAIPSPSIRLPEGEGRIVSAFGQVSERNPISPRCSIWSRSAPSPTWSGSTTTTASSCNRDCSAYAAAGPGPASPHCCASPAATRRARRPTISASCSDRGFNAAGRLDDMAVGIECLITNDHAAAERIARTLDELNRERRSIEADMHESALASLAAIAPADGYSLCLFDPGWHQGVIGIVASRLKERYHRPVIAFARGNDGELKGSGRSIGALHLRDALDLVAKREPGLIARFGGHAAAAGLTLRENDFARFRAAFESVAQTLLTPPDLARVIETDGALPAEHFTLEAARVLEHAVWGQGFPAPTFDDEFTVARQRVVGERHLKLRLAKDGREVDAMLFSHATPLPPRIRAVYRLAVNEWNGTQTLQITVEHWQPA